MSLDCTGEKQYDDKFDVAQGLSVIVFINPKKKIPNQYCSQYTVCFFEITMSYLCNWFVCRKMGGGMLYRIVTN